MFFDNIHLVKSEASKTSTNTKGVIFIKEELNDVSSVASGGLQVKAEHNDATDETSLSSSLINVTPFVFVEVLLASDFTRRTMNFKTSNIPGNSVYINIHLVKNIRNNLLNCKKFVLPAFSFSLNDQLLASSENGYISWRDFHDLYKENTKQKAFLRMAPKITGSAFYPGNNKQKVALALAIFHETTIAAFKICKPAQKDAIGFLPLVCRWMYD